MTWKLFSKKKDADKTDASASAAPSKTAAKTAGKGRPTPKRRDAQKDDLRPLVPTFAQRKARRKEEKRRMRERSDREYEAMEKGDLAHMPRAERQPIRIYIRDYVDARWNLSEFFLPVALGLMVLAIVLSPFNVMVANGITILLYVYLVACIVDLLIMWWGRKNGLRNRLITKYGADTMKAARSATYACSRALQLRRWRMPKPRKDKRGQWPR